VRPNVDVAERTVELALMDELGVRRINPIGIEETTPWHPPRPASR